MELSALKPVLTALVMPPASLLLLALLGAGLSTIRKRLGLSLLVLALALLWLLSCHGSAVWLAQHALPRYAALAPTSLQAQQIQAVVVLGGGVLPQAPEYGQAQPSAYTLARLRYGVWLARQSALPLAFSGGLGWAANGGQTDSEAQVAARVALQDYGLLLRWAEDQSRDTRENAQRLAPLLQRDGVQAIALVTHAWHMPRAVHAFEAMGLRVLPAPTADTLPKQRSVLEWLPSADGLQASQQILREVLAALVLR